MVDCNATLTTLTHTDEVVADTYTESPHAVNFALRRLPNGATVTRRGDVLYRDEVTVLTCVDSGCDTRHRNDIYGKTSWRDDTPGATPHVDPAPPLVSDEEVAEAVSAYLIMSKSNGDLVGSHLKERIGAALEAAARVRQNTNNNEGSEA